MGGARYLGIFAAVSLAACSGDLATTPDHALTGKPPSSDLAARGHVVQGAPEPRWTGMVRDAAGVLDVVELDDGSVGVRERARVAAFGLETPGYGPYACDPLFLDWLTDWPASFVGKTKYRAADYDHFLTGSFTFYPGAPVYYGTNTNSVTYLGSCNGSTENLTMEIHRRISGVWTKVLTVTVHGGEKYTFYSGVPAGYRAVLRSPPQGVVHHYGYGAAWTLSPRLRTP